MIEQKLEELIHQAFKELEYDDCFLVELKVNNTKVEAFLDSDESVTFEKCRKVSRILEAALDENLWLGEKYTLDVSSAGVGKPLKYIRQYQKNIGRTIEIKHTGGDKLKGTLSKVSEESIEITFEETIKEGKKKQKVMTTKEVAINEIKEAKIKVSF